MNTETRGWQAALSVLLLAAAYWLAAYFVADFCGHAGLRWVQTIRDAAQWPPPSVPLLLSALGAVGLTIAALPITGILVVVERTRAPWLALLVALPATATLLCDGYTLWRMGLPLPPAALALMGADALKTLLIPMLLAGLLRRWLPVRR